MKQVLISMRSQPRGEHVSLSLPELGTDGTGTAVHRHRTFKNTDEEQYNHGPKPTVFVSFTFQIVFLYIPNYKKGTGTSQSLGRYHLQRS